MLISNPLKKFLKDAPKKLKAKQVWWTWVKVEKVHISLEFNYATNNGLVHPSC